MKKTLLIYFAGFLVYISLMYFYEPYYNGSPIIHTV